MVYRIHRVLDEQTLLHSKETATGKQKEVICRLTTAKGLRLNHTNIEL